MDLLDCPQWHSTVIATLALLRTGTNTVAVSAGGDVILDISPNGLNVYDWLSHRGDRLGFYGQWPTEKPTNVPVTIEGVHEALVSLGLIQ